MTALTQIIRRTAVDIIWEEARLFAAAAVKQTPAPDLATAAVWAVHGSPCRPRDLAPGEDVLVAEVCDTLEDRLGKTLPAYEADHADADAGDIAFDLAWVAFEVERELREAAGE